MFVYVLWRGVLFPFPFPPPPQTTCHYRVSASIITRRDYHWKFFGTKKYDVNVWRCLITCFVTCFQVNLLLHLHIYYTCKYLSKSRRVAIRLAKDTKDRASKKKKSSLSLSTVHSSSPAPLKMASPCAGHANINFRKNLYLSLYLSLPPFLAPPSSPLFSSSIRWSSQVEAFKRAYKKPLTW